MRSQLCLLGFNGSGRVWPLYQDIVSAVLRGWRCGLRTCDVGHVLAVCARLVLGRKGAFEGAAALAVFPSWRRVCGSLLQSVFGLAQAAFYRLELLGLCGDGLLPGVGWSAEHVIGVQGESTFGGRSCPGCRGRRRA